MKHGEINGKGKSLLRSEENEFGSGLRRPYTGEEHVRTWGAGKAKITLGRPNPRGGTRKGDDSSVYEVKPERVTGRAQVLHRNMPICHVIPYHLRNLLKHPVEVCGEGNHPSKSSKIGGRLSLRN
jgi:hypothetical protein